MKSGLWMVTLAGLCLAGSASAQVSDTATRATPRRVPASCINFPVRDMSPRTVQYVYATVDTDNTVWTSGSVPSELVEDVSLLPGPAGNATFPLTLNTVEFGFNMVSAVITDFDTIVEFYDAFDTTAPVDAPVYAGAPIAAIRFQFTALPAPGAYTTGPIDISALAVAAPDAGLAVRLRYVEAGTETRLLGTDCNVLYEQVIDQATFASTMIGSTDSQFYRDVDADGIVEAAEGRTFAFPNRLGMYFLIEADAPDSGGGCNVDFNRDGFIDFFDYLDFVTAYEQGC